ncbi:hypothetical protein ACWD4P_20870 [Kitasatospora sp. NPDC002543]
MGGGGTRNGDVLFLDPPPGFTVYARLAVGEDDALAGAITAQLRCITEHQAQGRDAVADLVPAKLRAWFERNGYDPVDSWLEQKLCDIVLDRGRDLLGLELLARLPGWGIAPSVGRGRSVGGGRSGAGSGDAGGVEVVE